MTKISRFTERCVSIAQSVTGERGESAAPAGGGGFADYAYVSLHCLRIYLDTSYRRTIDLLKEMPQIPGEIGLELSDLPAPSTLCKAFDRIGMSVCRVLVRQSAQLHESSDHGSIDATYYERSVASHHYCNRTRYRVQKLKAPKSLIQTLKPSLTFPARRLVTGYYTPEPLQGGYDSDCHASGDGSKKDRQTPCESYRLDLSRISSSVTVSIRLAFRA